MLLPTWKQGWGDIPEMAWADPAPCSAERSAAGKRVSSCQIHSETRTVCTSACHLSQVTFLLAKSYL